MEAAMGLLQAMKQTEAGMVESASNLSTGRLKQENHDFEASGSYRERPWREIATDCELNALLISNQWPLNRTFYNYAY